MIQIRKSLEGIYYNTLVEVSQSGLSIIFRTVLTSSKHFRITLKTFPFCNIALNFFYAKGCSNCSGDTGTIPVAASETFLW